MGFEAQQQAWLDAAEFVDDKWEQAAAKADRVRRGYARLLDDDDGDIALASNTHELVVRFLSALDLRRRPRLITTDGEFHTIRRQLTRLEEEGVEVVRLAAEPRSTLVERLSAEVDDRTAAVLVSAVLFRSGRIVPRLGELMPACLRHGSQLLIDAYHALNIVPFSLRAEDLGGAFIVGGGYKYCQLGEGNGFMRFPSDCRLRPVITGWFSEFDDLAGAEGGHVAYGLGPLRFAGATYDPASHYRAAAVFDFFEEQRLTPEALRDISRRQIALLSAGFDALDADPRLIARDRTVEPEEIGGFLVLDSPHAGEICRKLREGGVWTDHRDTLLRLGPAPYSEDRQLEESLGKLGEAIVG